MGTYLGIFNGAASEEQKQAISPEQQQAFMEAWSAWARTQEGALVDLGAPLFRKRVVTSDCDAEFADAGTAYAVVKADSHDAAVAIFAAHPHLTLDPGNSIEVIQCPAPPAWPGANPRPTRSGIRHPSGPGTVVVTWRR